eukprot:g20626.t2
MAMQALGEATAWPEALKLLQLQHRQTDQLCLNAAMRALELSGEWCQALQLLEEMVSLKRFQEVVPLTMAMGACKRAREWAAALWVLQDLMPALQIDTWHEFARRGVFRREAHGLPQDFFALVGHCSRDRRSDGPCHGGQPRVLLAMLAQAAEADEARAP